MLAAYIGMAQGLAVQRRLSAAAFRRTLFAGLIGLGGAVTVTRALA